MAYTWSYSWQWCCNATAKLDEWDSAPFHRRTEDASSDTSPFALWRDGYGPYDSAQSSRCFLWPASDSKYPNFQMLRWQQQKYDWQEQKYGRCCPTAQNVLKWTSFRDEFPLADQTCQLDRSAQHSGCINKCVAIPRRLSSVKGTKHGRVAWEGI